MEKKPFKDVTIKEIFRDIDGTILIKTDKTYSGVNRSDILNCTVLIPNKASEYRGQMKKKENDSYCEVFDAIDISELNLKDCPDVVPDNNPVD